MHSVHHLSLRDAFLSSALLNNLWYISPRDILIHKFFITACIVFNKKSSMKAFLAKFCSLFFKQYAFYKYREKRLVFIPSLFVH